MMKATKICVLAFAAAFSALLADSLNVQAENAPQQTIKVSTDDCKSQIWPNITNECLLTLEGKKAEVTARIVS